jgi:hypothetical protein
MQSSSKFSGVPEDSQVPFLGVQVATSRFPQSGVATCKVYNEGEMKNWG